jgi:hypothetical protein
VHILYMLDRFDWFYSFFVQARKYFPSFGSLRN